MNLSSFIEPLKSLLVPRYLHGAWRLEIDRKEYFVPAQYNNGQPIKVSVLVVSNRSDSDLEKVAIRNRAVKNRFGTPGCEVTCASGFTVNDVCSEVSVETLPAHSDLSITFTQKPGSFSPYQAANQDLVFVKGKQHSQSDRRLRGLVDWFDNLYWQEMLVSVSALALVIAISAFVGYQKGTDQSETVLEQKVRRLADASNRSGGAIALWDFDAERDQFRIQSAIQAHPIICPNLDILTLNGVKSSEELRLKKNVISCIRSYY